MSAQLFDPDEPPSPPGRIDRDFERFHADNPQVYEQLVRLCRLAERRGRDRIGIGMLWERLRWEFYMSTTGDLWKLNNNYRSRYARKLMAEFPEFEGLFETRVLRS